MSTPKSLTTLIKVISTIFILSAVIIELGNIYAGLTQTILFSLPLALVFLGRFALVAHSLEGIIAFVYARSRKQFLSSAIASGIYTFFVGTVGLVEVLKTGEKTNILS